MIRNRFRFHLNSQTFYGSGTKTCVHEHVRYIRDRSFFMSMGGLVGFRGGPREKKWH